MILIMISITTLFLISSAILLLVFLGAILWILRDARRSPHAHHERMKLPVRLSPEEEARVRYGLPWEEERAERVRRVRDLRWRDTPPVRPVREEPERKSEGGRQ